MGKKMREIVHETCQICRLPHLVIAGLIADHGSPKAERCSGSNSISAQAKARRESTVRAARWKAITDARSTAMMVLDAFQLGRITYELPPAPTDMWTIEQVKQFLGLALVEYKMLYPKSNPSYGDHRQRLEDHTNCWCVFCGEFILRYGAKSWYSTRPAEKLAIEKHVIVCGLAMLAGLLNPVTPRTRVQSGQMAIGDL